MILQTFFGLGGGTRMPSPERKKARKAQTLRTAAVAGAAAVALVIARFAAHRTFFGSATGGFSDEALSQSGVFLCENCGHLWQGDVELVHPYDPYVKCPKCYLREARKAVRCPSCRAWVLMDLPDPPVPFTEMGKGDKRRWDLMLRRAKREARCPECGARLYPGGSGAGRGPPPSP